MSAKPRAGKASTKRSTAKKPQPAPARSGPDPEDIRGFASLNLPDTPENQAFFGALWEKYKDLPAALRTKMLKSELFGTAFELKLTDILPRNGARGQVTGDLYESVQSRMVPQCTPLEFLLVVMRHEEVPFSLRMQAAKEALPYVHERKASLTTGKNEEPRGALVVPGTYDVGTWEKASASHLQNLQHLREQAQSK